MLDNLIEEVAKGFLKGIGYIFADVLFNFVLYYIGWPVCKVLSLGTYLQKSHYDYR